MHNSVAWLKFIELVRAGVLPAKGRLIQVSYFLGLGNSLTFVRKVIKSLKYTLLSWRGLSNKLVGILYELKLNSLKFFIFYREWRHQTLRIEHVLEIT